MSSTLGRPAPSTRGPWRSGRPRRWPDAAVPECATSAGRPSRTPRHPPAPVGRGRRIVEPRLGQRRREPAPRVERAAGRRVHRGGRVALQDYRAPAAGHRLAAGVRWSSLSRPGSRQARPTTRPAERAQPAKRPTSRIAGPARAPPTAAPACTGAARRRTRRPRAPARRSGPGTSRRRRGRCAAPRRGRARRTGTTGRARLEVLQQVDDLALHRHVERRDRLVAHQDLGPQRERTGDPDALPLAAGELVRVPVRVVGVEADELQQLAAPRPAVRPAASMPWIANGSPTISLTDIRGFSDVYGSWNTICTSRRSCLRPARDRRVDVLAVDEHLAARRPLDADQHPRQRRLARAGLAHQAERCGRARGVSETPSTAFTAPDRTAQQARAYREVLDEVAYLEHGPGQSSLPPAASAGPGLDRLDQREPTAGVPSDGSGLDPARHDVRREVARPTSGPARGGQRRHLGAADVAHGVAARVERAARPASRPGCGGRPGIDGQAAPVAGRARRASRAAAPACTGARAS